MWQEIFYLILLQVLSVKSECTISLHRDLSISMAKPLLLHPGGASGVNGFYLPNYRGIITLFDDEFLDLVCPNGKLVLDDNPTTSDTGRLSCIDGEFIINERDILFSAITCTRHADHTASYTGNACAFNYSEVEIGFPVRDGFVRLYTVCFDPELENPFYAEHVITRAIAVHHIHPSITWDQGDFFITNNVNNLYIRSRQRATINALLGLDLSSDKYIARTGAYYLSKGHLAPKSDFVYGSQQRATFYFINAVPMWHIFKKKIWYALEKSIRKYSIRKSVDLTVYTGTYGVATLPHEADGEEVELYLYVEGDTNRIPVPRLIWKVVYEPTTQVGVVFIGVNNPYITSSKDVICTDICKYYKWVNWDVSNRSLGYGYCCSVPDFRRTVKTFPDIEVKKLLR